MHRKRSVSWLSKYEEKRFLKNFGIQNMKGTQDIRVMRGGYEANECPEVILLAGYGSRDTYRKS
jgi:hypothetical protein